MAYPTSLFGPESLPYTIPAAPVAPGVFTDNTIAQRGRYRLGQQLILGGGKKFRFALNGGSTLTIGQAIGSAAIIATDIGLTAAAAAVGARSITFTHGAATVVLNYFAEGQIVNSVTPGLADTYDIASHAALTSGGADTVYLQPGQSVRTALTTSTRVDLSASPYASVVVVAATILQTPVGIAITALTSGQWGWLQTAGPCGVICTGTMTIGSPAVMLLSGGTAGTPAPASAATQPVVGRVLVVSATGQASTLMLTLDN